MEPDRIAAARQRAASDLVTVWISSPEYECPFHYPWNYVDPKYLPDTSSQAKSHYLIPRETYERWKQIQLDWELMNEEMHQLTGKV